MLTRAWFRCCITAASRHCCLPAPLPSLSCTTIAMPHNGQDWRSIAGTKRNSLLASISLAWRFREDEVPPPMRLKDVTAFITRFLTPLEQQITDATVPSILENIQSFNWSAVEVARAFCHRAALAHQLVRHPAIIPRLISTVRDRPAACRRFSLKKPSNEPKS